MSCGETNIVLGGMGVPVKCKDEGFERHMVVSFSVGAPMTLVSILQAHQEVQRTTTLIAYF